MRLIQEGSIRQKLMYTHRTFRVEIPPAAYSQPPYGKSIGFDSREYQYFNSQTDMQIMKQNKYILTQYAMLLKTPQAHARNFIPTFRRLAPSSGETTEH